MIERYDFNDKIHVLMIYIIFTIFGHFMDLIFTEIIQLNFCGLSTMTKKNIEERARLDAILNNNNIEEDYNKEINKENNDKKKRQKKYLLKDILSN